ncbi:MAG TPA: PAS domain S-box protein [Deltaproteobacteria bacterium]|nr:PAS domain S-box protein [Deltaproteobacteria bacterium]HPR54735.1 PAS domain S-box protein [Deltaproteobacteria bacterium]HXK48526.1 PAS domain S-box protein [Deltaproteobacteria bacterium]
MEQSSHDRLEVLKIVLIYAFFGGVWIYFSDAVLGALVHDPGLMTSISISKGAIFIVFTATLLYMLISRYAHRSLRVLKQLQENEDLLHSVTANIPGVIYQFYAKDDGEYGVNFVSERVAEIFGIPGDLEDFFTAFAGRVAEEDSPRFLGSIRDSVAIGGPWDFEGRFLKPSGEVLWFHGMSKPRREKGRLLYHGVLLDITERRRAEEALRESEAAYRIIFDQSPNIVALSRLNGEYVDVNRMYLERLGLPRSEVLGKTDLQLGVIDREAHDELRREFGRRGDLDQFETRIWSPLRKEWAYVLISSKMISVKGESMILSIVNDITKRKQAEDALRESEGVLRSMLAATPVGVALLKDRFFSKVNNALCRITGYTEEEMMGMMTRILYPDEEEFLRIGRELYGHMEREGLGTMEAVLRRKDGELINVMLSLSPFNPEDLSAGVCATVHDITEQKRSDEEREILQSQLIQAQKMESVGRLAGGVAHDFNNMLSVIIGNTEMALIGTDPAGLLHKTLQDILHAGRRSADLTRQLLAFARKQTISPKVLDLNDTVAGMLKMLCRLIGEDVELAWMPGHGLWNVYIDPSQVDQLLANLAVNARDAIEETGKIVIETSNTTCDDEYCSGQPECKPGEYVTLAVSDNGCGMERETIANIFEPFFTTKKEGHGTGLGLATVYGIVKQNGGFVNVYSEPGKGTTFRIYLPRFESDVMDVGREHEEPKFRRGTETVLIVEDEETVLSLSRSMLERLGYTVLAARKPEEAISLAGEHEGCIDLLLTDVVMPDINGRDLAGRLCSVRPGMKCLYMSGYTANVIAHHGILDHGVHFLPKPFSLRELADKVREVLDRNEDAGHS